MPTLSKAREAVTRKVSGLAIPDCFAASTAAAEARLLAKPVAERTVADVRDLRRVSRQAARLEAV